MDTASLMRIIMQPRESRSACIETAREVLRLQPVFLDTETTGTDCGSEIVDLGIVDVDGTILYNQLIKPKRGISERATEVSGITNGMVANCQTIKWYSKEINRILNNRIIVAYNAIFDVRMLIQSYVANEVGYFPTFAGVYDCMLLYARFRGEYDTRQKGFRWHKLQNAATQCGIAYDYPLHRAANDADLTRRVFIHMAAQEF